MRGVHWHGWRIVKERILVYAGTSRGGGGELGRVARARHYLAGGDRTALHPPLDFTKRLTHAYWGVEHDDEFAYLPAGSGAETEPIMLRFEECQSFPGAVFAHIPAHEIAITHRSIRR
ncbi:MULTISPECIES: hypothetical protein [Actinotignum]|uniref:hypothetical protein n=1 Tax=Actinotignum TaxID=1653174 RepID=UPI00254D3FC3|nr:hypothetical protein [Actinotignum sanguinis]MDK7197508.1 hypothetical protein [Actinotignum sanguinis]